ncbi:MAG: PKD domain-containing protein, partial [Chitinophagaceae bacterium]
MIKTITVYQQAEAKFNADVTEGCAPLTVKFNNQTKNAIQQIWDFGNGATAEGNTPQASYPLAGTYTVKLTIVTDGGYASSTKTVTIASTNPAMLT